MSKADQPLSRQEVEALARDLRAYNKPSCSESATALEALFRRATMAELAAEIATKKARAAARVTLDGVGEIMIAFAKELEEASKTAETPAKEREMIKALEVLRAISKRIYEKHLRDQRSSKDESRM